MSEVYLACIVLAIPTIPLMSSERTPAEVSGIPGIESNVPVSPPGWAVLERKLKADGMVLELINMSALHARDVIVHAGTFGEHQFTTVKYKIRTDPEPAQPDSFTRAEFTFAEKSVPVNRKFFAVLLPRGRPDSRIRHEALR